MEVVTRFNRHKLTIKGNDMPPRGLIYGVGINDADYFTYTSSVNEVGKRIYYTCPYYRCWTNMLARCYRTSSLTTRPTYVGCSVTEEWHLFSNFKSWMEKQNWEGKQLDKDLLFRGNKIYSPETCIFVTGQVNNFIVESSTKRRGVYPLGVSAIGNSFSADCGSIISGKSKRIGLFKTPEEAHDAWLAYKLEQAHILADLQDDPRVAKVLVDRYKNYKSEEIYLRKEQ